MRRPGVEWEHSVQDAASIVRDFVKWDDTPISPEHFAESAARAYKIAMTPPMEPVVIVAEAVMGDQLPGMPFQLDPSLHAAQSQGATGLRNWLKAYGDKIQDPRKAWIELDYCVAISREDPSEARRLFADVKKRTVSTSPVWPRIKRLEKTYE